MNPSRLDDSFCVPAHVSLDSRNFSKTFSESVRGGGVIFYPSKLENAHKRFPLFAIGGNPWKILGEGGGADNLYD